MANKRRRARRPHNEVARYTLNDYVRQRVTAIENNPFAFSYDTPSASYRGKYVEKPQDSYAGLASFAYRGDSVVAACMRVRRDLFRQAKFCWREIDEAGPGKIFRTDDLKLLDTPWPNGTTGELLSRMITDVDLCGNSFIRHDGDRLRWLRPDWVSIVLSGDPQEDADVDVLGYVYTPGGTDAEKNGVAYTPDEICHWAPEQDPLAFYRGMSWVSKALEEVQGDRAATTHKLAFFKNGATLGPIVRVPAGTTLQQFKEFMAAAEEAHAGAQNAYKTMYLGGGAEVTLAAADFRQLDLKSVQGGMETRIAAVAGVHPVLVGLSEGLAGSSLNSGNFAAARRATAEMTLFSLWQDACGALQAFFDAPADAELWIRERDIPFLREEAKDRAEIFKTQVLAIEAGMRAGFKHGPMVQATLEERLDLLIPEDAHSGLFSVQMQPPQPGAGAPAQDVNGDGQPDAPGTKPDFGALRADLWIYDDDEIERAILDAYGPEGEPYDVLDFLFPEGIPEELNRAHYDVRVPKGFEGGGRFRKLSDRLISLLNDWAKGEGDDDPLDEYSRDQLRRVAKELADKATASGDHERAARLTPRRGASSDEIKLALYKDVRAHVRGQRDAKAEAPTNKAKFTLQSGTRKGVDVAVYRDPQGKPALYRENDAGKRGRLVKKFDSLDDMAAWADDNGEPRVAQWARGEARGKKPQLSEAGGIGDGTETKLRPVSTAGTTPLAERVAEQLKSGEITPAEAAAILTGGEPAKAQIPPPSRVREHILSLGTNEERRDYLAGLDMTKNEANALAKSLGARRTQISADATIDNIVKYFDTDTVTTYTGQMGHDAPSSPALSMYSPTEAAKLNPGLDMTVPESRDVIDAEARRRVETVLDDVDEMLAGDGSAQPGLADVLDRLRRGESPGATINKALRNGDIDEETAAELAGASAESSAKLEATIERIRARNVVPSDRALLSRLEGRRKLGAPASVVDELTAAVNSGDRDRVRQVSADIRGRLGAPAGANRDLSGLTPPQLEQVAQLAREDNPVAWEQYWQLRNGGLGHDEAFARVTPSGPSAPSPAPAKKAPGRAAGDKVVTQWGTHSAGPMTEKQRDLLADLVKRGAASVSVLDTRDPDLEELRGRGLLTIRPHAGTVTVTGRGLRELSPPAPGRATKLTPRDLQDMSANDIAQAARDGRVTPRAAAKAIRDEADAKERFGPLTSGGLRGPEASPERLAERERTRAEVDRLRALADEIETAPAAPGRAATKVAKAAVPTVDPSTFDISSLDGLTIRQKRARLKAMGFSPERIDEIAPTAAMAKKAGVDLPGGRRLTANEADALSTAQFDPQGRVIAGGRNRENLIRDGFIDAELGRITELGKSALAAHQPRDTFDALGTAQNLVSLKVAEDQAGLREAIGRLNLTQLRAVFRQMNVVEPGSRATTDGRFRLPAKRAGAAELRDVLFAAINRDHGRFAWRSEDLDPDDISRAERDEADVEPDEDEPVDEMDLALEHYTEDEDVERAAGHDITPGHDELHHFWTRGKGLARWVGSPKPWTTLVGLLSEHVPLEKAKVFASKWFLETFGFASGSDLNRVTHGKPPRGHVVGPG